MIEKNVKLWLGDGPLVSVRVSQFDTMWRFVFSIVYNSQPWIIPRSGGSLNTTAILNGRKPDGNVFAFDGTINGDNTVTVDADVQMTAVAGQTVCELSILSEGKVVGTANFVLDVEAAPKSPDDVSSDSTLPAYGDMIEQAAELVGAAQDIIAQGPFLPSGGTPGQVLTKTATGTEWDDVSGLPDGGNNGQVLTKTSDGAEWSDAGTPTQAQTNTALADYLDEHPEAVTNIPDRIKQALLACFQKVAWVDANGQTYYQDLYNAFVNKEVLSIAAVFTQGSAVIYDTDSLDTLKQYLTVTALYDDGTNSVVTTYELSGTLTEGTSTITVSYGGKTTTFNVIVSAAIQYTFATTGETVTITNGNHFKIDFKGVTNQNGGIINLSDLTLNGASTISNNSAVNNRSESWLTIPAGASVTLAISNMSLTASELLKNDGYARFLVNARKRNTSTSIFDPVGHTSYSASNLSSTKTFSTETIVSNLFVYFSFEKAVSLEFDLSLKVNDVEVLK